MIPLILALFLVPPQLECNYSSECRAGECVVADIRGGQKCVDKQYAVMVWDSECLKSVEKSSKTKMEAPMKEDGSGEPDMEHAKLMFVLADVDKGCGRIEIRKRGQP